MVTMSNELMVLHRTVFGSDPDRPLPDTYGALDTARDLFASEAYLRRWAYDNHSMLIHQARLIAVQTLIPSGRQILDLGGANAPLHRMGYPHPFDRVVMVDLPADERHEMYANIVIHDELASGELVLHYSDMTRLDAFEDEQFDLVWSGQSIEHVPLEAGERMCREAFRVLKPGGCFCLDTPNGAVTGIHAATAGLKFIHPEHFIEFTVSHLTKLLVDSGFTIQQSFGIRQMPTVVKEGRFDYLDFLSGAVISDDLEGSYIQFHLCRKPA